ncbi:hypothetical protein GWK41_02855 [Persephonella atlantica]|uniref:YbgF trimerisation domain-containing protein n=1 Tax=Persephonella atlantica TaxID=2699429 RepID=A0ABS1GGF4_9AQUI|nr:hypothetical protein [Persephonella atlantica]MBK3332005.1 hypothetical protein [Persephonella atlantica]
MRYLRMLLLVLVLVNIPVFSQESINSDVRLEIISQIKKYKEEIEYIKRKVKSSDSAEEKKLLEKQIKLIRNKLEKLRKTLEKYESISPVAG